MTQDSGSISARIRARLEKAQRRFHANDNISEFIEPGELDQLLAEVEGKVQAMLNSLVIDVNNLDYVARIEDFAFVVSKIDLELNSLFS